MRLPARLSAPLLLALALPMTTGCAGTLHSSYGYHHYHYHHTSSDAGGAILAGLLVGAAVGAAVSQSAQPEPERVVYVQPQPAVYVVPAPSPRDRVEAPPPTGFDAPAARSALGKVDLSACRDRGAPRGWGHAKVTYTPGGDVARVVVDEPAGLPSDAVTCIGERLGTAKVAAFSGADTSVGVTWFVR